MPRTQEVRADVFATAQQIAGGLFLLRRDVNRRERAGAIEDGELPGIAAVGFDAIAGPAGNQGGCDNLTRNVMRGERPLELEATGPGFVTALHLSRPSKALDEAQDDRDVRRQRVKRWRPLS